MKLEKAYSEDLKKAITAEDADYNFLLGKISSKYAFTCPDENCNAAVTCANLDKKKSQRKIPPYYKVVGEHDINCLINQAIIEKNKQKIEQNDIYSENDTYIDNAVRLNLRPVNHQRTTTDNSTISKDDTIKTGHKANSNQSNKRKVLPSKTVSSLVSAFLNKEKLIVQIPEVGILPIEDLFIEINGQDISNFNDEFRVYYGLAWINKVDKGFSVKFANKLINGNLQIRPSFFIALSVIENSAYAKFNLETLNKLCNKSLKQVFILSETGPRPKENEYLNFWLEGLEYMDYRIK